MCTDTSTQYYTNDTAGYAAINERFLIVVTDGIIMTPRNHKDYGWLVKEWEKMHPATAGQFFKKYMDVVAIGLTRLNVKGHLHTIIE